MKTKVCTVYPGQEKGHCHLKWVSFYSLGRIDIISQPECRDPAQVEMPMWVQ